MNIKTIIKVTQIAAAYISINGIAGATPPTKAADSSIYSISAINSRLPLKKKAYHSFTLDSNLEFLKYNGTLTLQQHPTKKSLPKKFAYYNTFTVTVHANGLSYSQNLPLNKGFASARFRLSRAAHNEGLQIVDSDASNEHAQLNLMIEIEPILIIDKYMHLFSNSDSGYFTLKPDYFDFHHLNKTLWFFKNMQRGSEK